MSAGAISTFVQLTGGRRAVGGLTKDEVTDHQRARMLAAIAEVVAAKGFGAVTVSDIIAAAGVSRATFYQQFTDKHDCFFAAFDAASERVLAAVRRAVPADRAPADRAPADRAPADRAPADRAPAAFGSLLHAYFDALGSEPAFARVFLVDSYAAGPDGLRRRAAGQQRFAEAVARLYGARTAADRFACEALVAAIAAMVTTRVADGDFAGLRGLHGPITDLADRLLGTIGP